MTKAELLVRLCELAKSCDPESSHIEADNALIDFINDDEITAAYDEVGKWYA